MPEALRSQPQSEERSYKGCSSRQEAWPGLVTQPGWRHNAASKARAGNYKPGRIELVCWAGDFNLPAYHRSCGTGALDNGPGLR